MEINIKRQKFFKRNITKAVDINTMLIYFSDMKDVTGLPKKYTISHSLHIKELIKVVIQYKDVI